MGHLHDVWTNDHRLHYVTAGTGQLIIFLHGFPDFWYLWKDQLAAFQQTHHVVVPDLPGYNLSDKPTDVAHYRIPMIVEDIHRLADSLNQKPLILVGHDWGSVVAWEFAARYPAYVDRLVVLSTPPLDMIRRGLRSAAQRKAAEYMLMVTSPQAEQILCAGDYHLFRQTVFGAELAVAPDYFTDKDHEAYHAAWVQPGAISGGVNYYRAAHFLDYFPESERLAFLDQWTQPGWTVAGERFFDGLSPDKVWGEPRPYPKNDLYDDACGRGVPMPTLFIVGEQEWVTLANQFDWFEQRVPRGQLVRIANAGHRVVHEHPALVTEYIRAFIERGK